MTQRRHRPRPPAPHRRPRARSRPCPPGQPPPRHTPAAQAAHFTLRAPAHLRLVTTARARTRHAHGPVPAPDSARSCPACAPPSPRPAAAATPASPPSPRRTVSGLAYAGRAPGPRTAARQAPHHHQRALTPGPSQALYHKISDSTQIRQP